MLTRTALKTSIKNFTLVAKAKRVSEVTVPTRRLSENRDFGQPPSSLTPQTITSAFLLLTEALEFSSVKKRIGTPDCTLKGQMISEKDHLWLCGSQKTEAAFFYDLGSTHSNEKPANLYQVELAELGLYTHFLFPQNLHYQPILHLSLLRYSHLLHISIQQFWLR